MNELDRFQRAIMQKIDEGIDNNLTVLEIIGTFEMIKAKLFREAMLRAEKMAKNMTTEEKKVMIEQWKNKN